MDSKIAKLIGLKSEPVAILQAETAPKGAMQFKPGVWGCSIALLIAASKGRTAAFSPETTVCLGAKSGLGFQKFPHGWIEYFLSCGNDNVSESEFYKKTPKLARAYTDSIPDGGIQHFLLMKPLSQVQAEEKPLCVIFLVNADQLSALATLASYDQMQQDTVRLLFGAGCVQSVLYPMISEQKGENFCYVGLTDPSARKCVPKDLLSFGIPYHRFLALEEQADESFLTKKTWQNILARQD